MLAELVRQLAAISPETERTCFEYLRRHVAKTPDAKAEAAAGIVLTLWSEIEPDLAELDEYGGGDYETQDHVGELLYELSQKLQKDTIPRDDRRALLDEVLPYIRSGNAGMDDALYDVAYAACRDDDDLRDLAERFEALAKDWPIDHARRIYRRLGDRENYLVLRRHRMKYGVDPVGVLSAMRYPNVRFEGAEVLKIAAALEEQYPDRILAFYLSGLPRLYQNATRETYARWAKIVGKVRHMWVDVLKAPTRWDTFARQLKAANLRRSAFHEEFAKVVPEWNQP